MENEINELKNTAILDINIWSGLGKKPGVYGTLVMSDGKVYKYEIYHNYTSEAAEKMQKELAGLSQEERTVKSKELLEEIKVANIEELYNLSEFEVDKLIEYLVVEEKVFETKYEEHFMFDAGYNITVNIGDKTRTIKNVEPELYERVKKHLDDIESK